MPQMFKCCDEIFTPDDSGEWELGDDGKFYSPGKSFPRNLFKCGPNEYTTHNLKPKNSAYRKIGMVYIPDAKNGTVNIDGEFPFYITSENVPVYALPENCFTSVPYTMPFSELVRLHCGNRRRSETVARQRKIYQRKLKSETMKFNCFRCGKQYETTNYMKAHCSDTCLNARWQAMKKANQDYADYGVSPIIDLVEKGERWQEIPYQKEIMEHCQNAHGALIRADLFPYHMQKPASIILDRYRRMGYLKIFRIDRKTGIKVYVHAKEI